MKIFLISPVRNVDRDTLRETEEYVTMMEENGHQIHWPVRNTNQIDPIGDRIIGDNIKAIRESDEIHIWWDKNSVGSIFDLGVARALGKKLRIVNIDDVIPTQSKSMENFILKWHSQKYYD